MFKRNYGRSGRFGKPAFGRKRNSHKNFNRRNSAGFRGKYIDPTRFIYKAEPTIEAPDYLPKNAFVDFCLDDRIKNNIAVQKFVRPTPIQDQTIPHIINGSDVVGIANTGTGKTAAFILPLINKALLNQSENVLVIVPTRELAQQINEEFIRFRGNLKMFSVCCVGGSSISQQIHSLRYNHNFVIGTPGRLKDLIERKVLNPFRFGTIVLDEADRMLDMGFINDIRFIIVKMPKNRQTLFFSATITHEIDGLIREFLRDPVTISVKTGDTPQNVDQNVVYVKKDQEKIDVLHNLLIQPEFNKVLIFGRTKHGVEKLSKTLSVRGFKAESIHGNKNQNKRQKALQSFKGDYVNILVATDVAARGLDIPAVSHVINYDVPDTYEDYIHRIGRTGRAGQAGKALTFLLG